MSKHTPRPWKIEKCQCGHEKCHTYGIKNVGTFYQGCGFDLADAKLVAAAPELLAALGQLLDRLDFHGNIDLVREEGPIEDAREAVAKAKGE